MKGVQYRGDGYISCEGATFPSVKWDFFLTESGNLYVSLSVFFPLGCEMGV